MRAFEIRRLLLSAIAASIASLAAGARTAAAATGAGDDGVGSIAVAVFFAFAGGVLLNLMPCVFPVLSLKILGFVQQAHSDRAKIRTHGWAFTLGVMISFWLLAGVLIALRATGERLGWGFQLQSPLFVAALTMIVFALALNLCGVFDIGTSLTRSGSLLPARHGIANSFWTGALATVVATPCTAPFMGSALGYAVTQPPAVSMSVFTALGAGMAAPYLALSYYPVALSRLPKPGPWMETFKQLLAFPLFATAIWLLHVFSLETAESAVWTLMGALLLLSFACWIRGRAQAATGTPRASAGIAAVVALAAVTLGASAANTSRPAQTVDERVNAESFWQPWSVERVAQLRESGSNVFVNFTAAWCLTCKVNEQVVFSRDDVRRAFREANVIALEADWTNEDDEIAEALAEHGRDGVPLYVYYPADSAAPPVILPQVLTPEILREIFAAARAR